MHLDSGTWFQSLLYIHNLMNNMAAQITSFSEYSCVETRAKPSGVKFNIILAWYCKTSQFIMNKRKKKSTELECESKLFDSALYTQHVVRNHAHYPDMNNMHIHFLTSVLMCTTI